MGSAAAPRGLEVDAHAAALECLDGVVREGRAEHVPADALELLQVARSGIEDPPEYTCSVVAGERGKEGANLRRGELAEGGDGFIARADRRRAEISGQKSPIAI